MKQRCENCRFFRRTTWHCDHKKHKGAAMRPGAGQLCADWLPSERDWPRSLARGCEICGNKLQHKQLGKTWCSQCATQSPSVVREREDERVRAERELFSVASIAWAKATLAREAE